MALLFYRLGVLTSSTTNREDFLTCKELLTRLLNEKNELSNEIQLKCYKETVRGLLEDMLLPRHKIRAIDIWATAINLVAGVTLAAVGFGGLIKMVLF